MRRLYSILLLSALLAVGAMPAGAQMTTHPVAVPVSGDTSDSLQTAKAPPEQKRPMDPRVSTALTVVAGAAVLAVGVVTFPWLVEVMSIGSYSVLCTVAPVC